MYYVYVVINEPNEVREGIYIGYTNDLERRMREHKKKFPKDKLIYYEAYLYERDARDRERRLKYYGSAWRALKKRINA